MATPTPNVSTSNPQAGRNGTVRGNRQRGGRGGRPGRGTGSGQPSNRPVFKGNTEEMKANVFECHHERDNRLQFDKTMEALEEYAKKNLKFYEDVACLFATEMAEPKLTAPAEPPEDPKPSMTATMIFGERIKEYMKRETALRSTQATLYAVIWGQCSEAMRTKLKSLKDYDKKRDANDCFWALSQVRAVTMKFDSHTYPFLSVLDAKEGFYTCKQGEGQTVDEFLNILKGWAANVEHCGGTISEDHSHVPEIAPDGSTRSRSEREDLAREHTMAARFIRGADRSRYGTLLTELSNRYTIGTNDYPTDLSSAYSMVANYRTPTNTRQGPSPRVPSDDVRTGGHPNPITLAQQGHVIGTNGNLREDITCFNCHRTGHFSNHCPSEGGDTGTTLVQQAYVLTQAPHERMDPNWILLDTESTVSVFNNPRFLRNIRPGPHVLRAITNGGHQDSRMVGDFPNLPAPVWYNPKSIANILAMADVRKVCRVTMDTSLEATIFVHKLDGGVMRFRELPSGLYVHDANSIIDNSVDVYTFVHTVAENKKKFTPRQIASADAARTLYRKLCRPSEADYYDYLSNNRVHNCPITTEDARRAFAIYGPDIATLKGKMRKGAPAPYQPDYTAVAVPPSVLEHHRHVTLCIDFLCVQGVYFLHTISRHIGFRTLAYAANRNKLTILNEIRRVVALYAARQLIVVEIRGDQEFGCIVEEMRPIHMDLVPKDGHVGEVERSIRTLKERVRSTIHGLPYTQFPRLFIQHLLRYAIQSLNRFPKKNGISEHMSPETIITGEPPPDFNKLRIEFGTYAQFFEAPTPTNTVRARSTGGIALDSTGNADGSWYFLSLATGAVVSRHQWTETPITDATVARVAALGHDDGQPPLPAQGLVVEWRHDQDIDLDTYDEDFVPNDERDDPDRNDHADPLLLDELADLLLDQAPLEDPLPPQVADLGADIHELGELENDENEQDIDQNTNELENESDDENSEDEYGNTTGNEQETPDYEYENEQQENEIDQDEYEDEQENETNDGETGAVDDEPTTDQTTLPDQGAPPTTDEGAPTPIEPTGAATLETVLDEPEEDQGAPNKRNQGAAAGTHFVGRKYDLRPRRDGKPTRFAAAMDTPHNSKSYDAPTQLLQDGARTEQKKKIVFGRMFAQMTARAGIKEFGKEAENALMAEFAQLDDLDVFEAVRTSDLSNKQRKGALRAINLINKKRDGRLKGRTVADGSAQRSLYDKSETASPTVGTDALMLSLIVDAHEGRDVAFADVAGAYLKADMEDYVLLKFTGVSVDIMCNMNKKYKPFVTTEGGKRVLYVRLLKALYGCVQSALLWYRLFSGTLQKMGFELNPYDPCMANKTINGKQCTIVWYVDDMKISHMEHGVVTGLIKAIEERFGSMTVTRGKEHVFLGMNIRFTDENTVEIHMSEYLQECIRDCGQVIEREAATPARKNLFDVDAKSVDLDKTAREVFHSVVAKLLYVSIRARMDILLPVSFLCTRVAKSTQQDSQKLRRVLEYVKGTMALTYTLGADNLESLRSWVDAAFAVHPDMKSHTGGVMSFGTGGLMCKSTKQKLNTKSSTEAELVGASDYLPHAMWMQMLMEAQGHSLKESYFEQDNESAIKLEKNGRMSAGQKSRHINIRYFFIKDRTQELGITIRHCPTLRMLGDFFTKPLQGALFRKFRDVILGYSHVTSLTAMTPPTPEERVGRDGEEVRAMDGQMTRSDKLPVGNAGNISGGPGHPLVEVPTEEKRNISWADVVKRNKTNKPEGTGEFVESTVYSLN